MPPTIVATPGASNANSYLTVAEADAYFDARLPLTPAWEDADSRETLLVMATRLIDSMFRGGSVLIPGNGLTSAYYIVRPKWTGSPATTTQKLAWPRSGMYDANGNAISESVIPDALKEAVAEFAGQLQIADRSLDSSVTTQGISSVSAGSVSVSFRQGWIDPQVVPDAVMNLLPPSWYALPEIESANGPAVFEVLDI